MKRFYLFLLTIIICNSVMSQNEIEISLNGSEKVSETYNTEAQEIDYLAYCSQKYDKSIQQKKLDAYYSKRITKEFKLKDFQNGATLKLNIKINNDSNNSIKILESPKTFDGSLVYKMLPRNLDAGKSFNTEIKIEGKRLDSDIKKKGYSIKRMEIRTLNHNNEPIIYLLFLKISK